MPTPCGGSCGQLFEAYTSKSSAVALHDNIVGVRKLFEGCGPGYSGLGFDDWLKEVGSEQLATDMIDALQGVDDAIESHP